MLFYDGGRGFMDATAEPVGSLLTRVPGRAQPRAQAVKEFEKAVAALKKRYRREFWPLFVPKAEDIYRWQIQLECGCVREVFTRGKDSYPDQHGDTDPFTERRLPAGEYWCSQHPVVRPYQDIVEWYEREIHEFPADPEEPQHDMSPEIWAVIRHSEPHSSASWRVQLACGHACRVATDLDFTPEGGPRLVSTVRRDEMRQELEDYWAAEGPRAWPEEGPRRDHLRRMLDLGFPLPEPDRECWACAYAKNVTGYQRIGWLVPRTKTAAPPTQREQLAAELAKAEAEVRRLRRKLEDEG
ncbi:hypothetical protein [Granulicoccus phenolivorans]|uniref:hypothetical protein n=1 Tax=Granulicoccus phenolivorans TaxID=266854 RepID=UPI0003FB55EB|nr:hypothetical protein [Granulicoccus phenolivorans]